MTIQDEVKDNSVIIYTDGACSGNPGPGGWAFVLFDGKTKVIECADAEEETTNNRMELQGAMEAFKYLQDQKFPTETKIKIHIDSSYVILGITKWIKSWKRREWKNIEGKSVSNQDLWMEFESLTEDYKNIKWIHIPGHAGIPGNERCDQLSVQSMKGHYRVFDEYDSDAYDYQIFQPVDLNRYKKIDPFYLSYVNGNLIKHTTWPECESAVRGKPGAKFKKIKNLNDEEETLKLWGIGESEV